MKIVSKKLADILRKTAIIALTIIAGLGFYTYNAQVLVGNPLPMPFGVGTAVVVSGSMEPAIHVNDLLIVKEAKKEAIHVGDVIVFQGERSLIAHRVVEMQDEYLITQGDANNVADAPIDWEQVKGRMIGRVPAIGNVVGIIRQPVVCIFLLVVAIYMFEKSFRMEKEEKNEELEALRREIERLKEED